MEIIKLIHGSKNPNSHAKTNIVNIVHEPHSQYATNPDLHRLFHHCYQLSQKTTVVKYILAENNIYKKESVNKIIAGKDYDQLSFIDL